MSTFLRPHTCPVCGTTHQCCRAPIDNKWASAFARYNINADAYNASVKQDYAQRRFRKPDTEPAEDIKPTMESLGSVLRQISDTQKLELLTPPVPDVPAKPVEAPIEDKSPAPLTLPADTVQPKPLPIKTEPAEPVVLSDSTTIALDHKIDHWKKELLDTSKRNKMINYRETKRATLRILEPGAEELFNRLAFSEKALSFQRPISKDSDFRTFAMLSLLETLNYNLPVHVGDIKADGTIVEREKTLKNLRAKTKLAQEEQGTNILYLSFGFILWREHNRDSSPWLKAPVLMMPVSLGLKSLNAPYTLSRYDDEIEVNPTLDYLFNAEYGIDLPTFELKNRNSFNDYMDTIEEIVDKRGWKLVREVNLGLLSFLKISMYHDINNNRELILNNPVLQAISGDRTALGDLPPEAVNFHFDESSPQQWHEVVDSDSSQEEAILLSKLGVSFVMQGPPGTGKSQTITNIIAEALADGKKVLFVSEKAAALQVVLKRLTDVNLSDFCLSLHNYKANKKEIIDNIGANLSLPQEYTKQSVLYELTELFYNRKYLDEYAEDLHKIIEPLGDSIYVVYGKLSKLETASVVEFSVDNPTEISREKYASILYCISAFEKALHNMEGPLSSNPWYLTKATSSGQAFKTELIAKTKDLNVTLDKIAGLVSEFNARYHASLPNTWSSIAPAINRVNEALSLPLFPYSWHEEATLSEVQNTAEGEQHTQSAYYDGLTTNREYFNDGILDAPIDNWLADISRVKSSFTKLGFKDNGTVFSDAIRNIGAVESALATLRAFSEQYDHANQLIGLSGTDTLPNAITLHLRIFFLFQSHVTDGIAIVHGLNVLISTEQILAHFITREFGLVDGSQERLIGILGPFRFRHHNREQIRSLFNVIPAVLTVAAGSEEIIFHVVITPRVLMLVFAVLNKGIGNDIKIRIRELVLAGQQLLEDAFRFIETGVITTSVEQGPPGLSISSGGCPQLVAPTITLFLTIETNGHECTIDLIPIAIEQSAEPDKLFRILQTDDTNLALQELMVFKHEQVFCILGMCFQPGKLFSLFLQLARVHGLLKCRIHHTSQDDLLNMTQNSGHTVTTGTTFTVTDLVLRILDQIVYDSQSPGKVSFRNLVTMLQIGYNSEQ